MFGPGSVIEPRIRNNCVFQLKKYTLEAMNYLKNQIIMNSIVWSRIIEGQVKVRLGESCLRKHAGSKSRSGKNYSESTTLILG
jgi:hypothetical protein